MTTLYLVLAMRLPSFNDAAIQPHRDFLEALRAQGKLHLTAWVHRRQRRCLCAVQCGHLGAGAGHRCQRSIGDPAGLRAERARMDHPLRPRP